MRIRPIMLLSIIALVAAAPSGAATDACKKTSKAAFGACKEAVKHDQLIAKGTCANDPDRDAAKACVQQASADAKDEVQSCKDQADYRKVVCGRLGPAPYAPAIGPANFTSSTTIDNPLFPLVPGTTFIYEGQTADGFEHVEFAVTHATKVILGITCVEVHDTAALDGVLSEDTRDWFAQDDDGNVWYFGENTAIIENGLPVDLSGSWTGGVAGAQPGIVMEASPAVGDFYRQEFSLGNAEDLAEVTSLTASVTVPAATCTGDCLETEESTTLDPEDVEHKFYESGVGNIQTVDVATGEHSDLIEVTTGNPD